MQAKNSDLSRIVKRVKSQGDGEVMVVGMRCSKWQILLLTLACSNTARRIESI